MALFTTLLDWFAGGRHRYMTLIHCMNHDMPWIRLTVALDLAIAAGYVVIALHWWTNERPLKQSPAKEALRTMKAIFIFCGICGYLFIPIKMFWPAWRLYDIFLAVLAYYTWRYALNTRNLKVVYNELTRSERLAEDLERSREESRRRSQFLNAVSHDLKTPLNGLLLHAELAELELSSPDPEAIRETLAQIKSSARATADLLNRFLELGRLDWSDHCVEPSAFEVGELVGEVGRGMQPRAHAKGLSLVAQAPKGVVVVTDRLLLERILTALVENAIKFTHEGGVSIAIEDGRDDLSIHVEDSGEGVAPEDQARIFDDFIQVHNRERDSRKGFGLGLSIARRLATRLGARITLVSHPGRGSRFTVVLPRSARVGEPERGLDSATVGAGPRAAASPHR